MTMFPFMPPFLPPIHNTGYAGPCTWQAALAGVLIAALVIALALGAGWLTFEYIDKPRMLGRK